MISVNPILYINTAVSRREIALVSEETEEVFSKIWGDDNRDSEEILPKLEKLFDETGLGFDDLKGILVINGPGPFTSLRVGISVANTIAYVKQIPIVEMNVVEYYSLCFKEGDYIGVKAWGDHLYFDKKGEEYNPENVYTWEEVKEKLSGSDLIGDLKEHMLEDIDEMQIRYHSTDKYNKDELVKFFKNNKPVKIAKPLYLRPPKITKSKKLYK